MDFEQVILEQVKTINPAAQASWFNHTLFIVTDNAVCTGDVFQIIDVLQAANPKFDLQAHRVGDEIAVDFAWQQIQIPVQYANTLTIRSKQMSQVLIKNGSYRNKPVTNHVFTLVKDFTQGAKGGFVTVDRGRAALWRDTDYQLV